MIFNLSDQSSVAGYFMAELRSVTVQQDRMRFRRNLERIGEILAYEISKKLPVTMVETETSLGIAAVRQPEGRVVLATILRAGLPFHQGMLNYFDRADNAFISAYRRQHKNGSFDIQLDYITAPDLDNATLILSDPMLATGASVLVALKELSRFGTPRAIHLAAVISSSVGIDTIRNAHPDIQIWTGAIDEELTAKAYIVPGLGDAGDLAFGEK